METCQLPKIEVVEISAALGIRVPKVGAVMSVQVTCCVHAKVLIGSVCN